MEVIWRVKVASWAEESTQMIWPWVQVSMGNPSTVVLCIMVESHPAAGHFIRDFVADEGAGCKMDCGGGSIL
ncbi:MAG: hypothetical protein C5B44_00680 [Acidobacteria bacterium]|nr:MAG: hypothetical protein C5B44_00680 [Acidobacteriota bacterium]